MPASKQDMKRLRQSAFRGDKRAVRNTLMAGADPNHTGACGNSSLHYAACFGRPAIGRVLLRHGANPDLRDEDGKTPLDKARERNDEGHREVAALLQSPGDWMIPAASSSGSQASAGEAVTPA